MASLAATTCRLSARRAAYALRSKAVANARDLSSSSVRCAAYNFAMPAMSPTMTEGNVSSWKVKEGDSFSVGDVLLEIETDKAQMDIEAQDDGIIAKIMTPDGSKAVQVGSRIAVLAEPGDDLESLEIPADDSAPQTASKESSDSSAQQEQQSSQQESESQQSKSEKSESQPQSSLSHQTPANPQYPLYPSVEHLIHTHGISEEDVSKINATGPAGRLLKGDVLAYLGNINKSYPSELAEQLSKLAHLDLTNVKKAQPKTPADAEPKKETKKDKKPLPDLPEPATEIAVPVSLAAVFRLQHNLQENLGVDLPLSTVIARASEIANENLPKPTTTAPDTNDLFNQVLGIQDVHSHSGSRGRYIPNITALPPPTPTVYGLQPKVKRPDLIDILAARGPVAKPIAPQPVADIGVVPGGAGANNVFSLIVEKGEERRARVYLERVKSVLEAEPGRCVL